MPHWDQDQAIALPEESGALNQECRRLKEELQGLEASSKKYKQIFDLSPDAVVCCDLQGRFRDWNAAFNNLLWYSDEEIERLTIFDVTPPEYHQEEYNRIAEFLETGSGRFPYYKEYLRKDGARVPVELNGYGLDPGAHSEPLIFAAVRDISARVAAERALQESEERTRLALEGGGLALWDINVQTDTVFVNDQHYRLLGYQPGEVSITQEFWLRSIHPADRERVNKAYDAHLRGETALYEEEYRLVSKSGKVVWVYARAAALARDEQGLPTRITGTLLDISDRKTAEQQMSVMHERFSRAFMENPSAIAICGLAPAELIDANEAFLNLFRLQKRESVGRTLEELGIRGEIPADTVAGMLKAGLPVHNMQAVFKTPDGRRLEGLFSAEMLELSGQSCVMGTFIDQTEQRRIEREKAQLEEQLRQAQKMESIGRLAGGIAHDLNNLLTPILGYAGILLEEMTQGIINEQRPRQIYRAAEAAKDLTQQLLAFSRKQVFQLRDVDLNQLIIDFEKLLRLSLRENVELVLQCDPGAGPIRADAAQVRQVLMNLALNSQDSMPGGGKLSISTNQVCGQKRFSEASAPGTYVLLSISDTGCGMDKETREKALEPFFTTKEKESHSGLGLPTVYGIVMQHGGSLEIRSSRSGGTVVDIYWPSSAALVQPASTEPVETILRGSERILVVEDNSIVQDLVVEVLKQKGYQVTGARDLESATAACAAWVPDLLLTDVILPQGNGKTLYEELRRKAPALKVLYMSGYPGEVIGEQGILAEAEPFLYKPFSPAVLTNKVREVLDG